MPPPSTPRDEPAPDHLDRREAEVGLGLAATGREPDEVDEVAVLMIGVDGRGKRREK